MESGAGGNGAREVLESGAGGNGAREVCLQISNVHKQRAAHPSAASEVQYSIQRIGVPWDFQPKLKFPQGFATLQ